LNDKGIDVLICGGIGGGAQAALQERGIELCAGAAGDADAAVAAYLRGELENTGANCDHHGEGHHCGELDCGDDKECDCGSHDNGEDCHCGDDEEGCCGDDEEGCCGDDEEGRAFGCCSGTRLKGKNVGKKVSVHYRGTFNDGTQFDSSYDRNAPLEFICGAGQMIAGFDAAVADMGVGQAVDIHLMPAEAYGEVDPAAFFTIGLPQLPGAEELTVGEKVYLQDQFGRPFPVKVAAKDDKTITFDANHEMAGKELNFRIELLEVEE
ncbi:MAG: FKBP-type peptidyl-prolyl cis-trans isomerase, partial [Lachnospiraceae bacterium]|nr:FKBP-type peptidyl-prolyl cis-trans isomerase [Lachnospiraceae bacterium]